MFCPLFLLFLKETITTKKEMFIIKVIMEHEIEKSHIKYFAIKLGIYALIAILVFVFREQLIANLKFFIGGLMILYGVEEVIFEVIYHGINFWKENKVYLGFIELIFGSVLMFSPLDLETTCVIWATWSIVREAFEIKELVTEIKSNVLTIISGIESLAVIVLSVMLILEPGEHHALIHLYLLLAELILTPLVPLLDEIMIEKKNEKKEEEH